MEEYIINGGRKLYGEITIAPAKNACLPLIASSILFNNSLIFKNAPKIADVEVMAEIIKGLGGSFSFLQDGLQINTENIYKYEAECNVCKKARASFFIAGALLSRFKKAIVPMPGGCNLGLRPVDIHIDTLKQLGAKVETSENSVYFEGVNMKSGRVYFSFPSVGATVNAICASVFLEGETILHNVAREPEIVDLCNFLNLCGCKIGGIGSSTLTITGIKRSTRVNKIEYEPIQDRIEAGTFMCAVSACGGELNFKYEKIEHLKEIIALLRKCGVEIKYEENTVYLKRTGILTSNSVIADVYPAFPTDMQSVFCALSLFCNGESVIRDKVFNKRFCFLKDLQNVGAMVEYNEDGVKIFGGHKLNGGDFYVNELRGGAGIVVASLAINGKSRVKNIELIKRGYDSFDFKLRTLGADITHRFVN